MANFGWIHDSTEDRASVITLSALLPPRNVPELVLVEIVCCGSIESQSLRNGSRNPFRLIDINFSVFFFYFLFFSASV